MAYADPPHPEERSRERVSKDAKCQIRDDSPLIAKQDVCMPPLSAGTTGIAMLPELTMLYST